MTPQTAYQSSPAPVETATKGHIWEINTEYPITKQLHSLITWALIAKQKGPDSGRPTLEKVSVQETDAGMEICCTDGHRLHLVTLDREFIDQLPLGCRPGCYEVVTASKKSIVLRAVGEDDCSPYPDYKKIFPDSDSASEIVLLDSPDKKNGSSGFYSRAYTTIIRAFPGDDTTLNYDFVKDAIGLGNMTVRIKDEKSPVLFTGREGQRKALVMPMRS